jgi:hypothetical protein
MSPAATLFDGAQEIVVRLDETRVLAVRLDVESRVRAAGGARVVAVRAEVRRDARVELRAYGMMPITYDARDDEFRLAPTGAREEETGGEVGAAACIKR